MDIEKLIERLRRYSEPLISYKLDSDFAAAVEEAATALSTLQAENEKLRDELEQVKRDSLARGTRRAAVDETGNPL